MGKVSQVKYLLPTLSRPRRPARPAICVYSPGSSTLFRMIKGTECEMTKKKLIYKEKCLHLPLKRVPSCFLMELNTTALAGIFTPIANVSVANRTITRKL